MGFPRTILLSAGLSAFFSQQNSLAFHNEPPPNTIVGETIVYSTEPNPEFARGTTQVCFSIHFEVATPSIGATRLEKFDLAKECAPFDDLVAIKYNDFMNRHHEIAEETQKQLREKYEKSTYDTVEVRQDKKWERTD